MVRDTVRQIERRVRSKSKHYDQDERSERASTEKADHSEQVNQTPSQGACAWCARCVFFYDAPHDKKMCSAIMSQKASRRPSFDLRLHWLGVSSPNMQHLRWSAVEVGGLGSVWVLSRGAPHQGQEAPPENLFCSVGVKVNFWPCGCPKSAARPAFATS